MSAPEVRELKTRIRELERVLGKKTLENEILTEAVKLVHEKNCRHEECGAPIVWNG